jgi:hypothetical protein
MLRPEFQIPPLFGYVALFLWALSGAIVGMHKPLYGLMSLTIK